MFDPVKDIQSSRVILHGHFKMNYRNRTYHVQTLLYSSCIIINTKGRPLLQDDVSSLYKIQFNFDLIFELIRYPMMSNKLGAPFGLRFKKYKNEMVLESSNVNQLLEWRDRLAQKIAMGGFHQIFEAVKKLGAGNSAYVYLVIKKQNKQKYAIKSFSKAKLCLQYKGKAALLNQIDIMRDLKHKNLMKLYQVYETQKSIYLCIELLQGGQLLDKINSKNRLKPQHIKLIMKGILQGLQVMHKQGIMHRDLKPENVLLRSQDDYDCVIGDFGLAQRCDQEYLFERCGSPGYVAPQIANLKDKNGRYTQACDLFSLGVIFYVLALRKFPFQGKDKNQLLANNRKCFIKYDSKQALNLPPTWLSLLKGLLQYDPKRRLTASQALDHQFFTKDQMFKRFSQQRKSISLESDSKRLSLFDKASGFRQKTQLLKDSCLMFKMNTHMTYEKTIEQDKQNIKNDDFQENQENIKDVDSPLKYTPRSVKINQSRFLRND